MSAPYLDRECDFCGEPATARIHAPAGLSVSTGERRALCWQEGDVTVCLQHETEVRDQIKEEEAQ